MSSDESSNAASSERRDAVREKAQQVKARQSRARLIRRTTLVTLGVAFIAVIAVVVTWTVSSSASKPMADPSNVSGGFVVTGVTGTGVPSAETGGSAADATPAPSSDPAAAATEPTPTTTPSDAPAVDIRVYVDYLSTGSRDFQVANVKQLSKWVDTGAATLTYYPVAMLTAKSNGTKYSLRAAGAAACVAQNSPDYFFAFNNALLTQQPDVDSDGLSDTELADLAQAVGVDGPKAVRGCIEAQSYTGWVKTATEQALHELPGTGGVALTATPMILVNGTQYVGKIDDPKEFAQFVLTVASDSYYKATPSPTVTPTP
jgi:protein-disulfide isomerase